MIVITTLPGDTALVTTMGYDPNLVRRTRRMTKTNNGTTFVVLVDGVNARPFASAGAQTIRIWTPANIPAANVDGICPSGPAQDEQPGAPHVTDEGRWVADVVPSGSASASATRSAYRLANLPFTSNVTGTRP